MPEPKTHGGRRKGAGRPRVSDQPLRRATIWLTAGMAAAIKRFGGGNLSAGVRRLYAELVADPIIDDD